MSGPNGSKSNEYAWEHGAIGTVTAGAVSGSVVPANPARRYLVVCNTSASDDAYLALGPSAIVGQGILLKANGGTLELNANNMFHGPVNVISAGTPALSYQEGS